MFTFQNFPKSAERKDVMVDLQIKVRPEFSCRSYFLFLAANILPLAVSNLTSLHCKSWLELVEFLRSQIRERWGWCKVLASTNKKCYAEFWSDFNYEWKNNYIDLIFISNFSEFLQSYYTNLQKQSLGSVLKRGSGKVVFLWILRYF